MYFVLALLNTVDGTGDVDVNSLLRESQNFYLKRHENKLIIDRPNSPYNNIERTLEKSV